MIIKPYITAGNVLIFIVILLATVAAVIYGNTKSKNADEKNSFLDFLILGRQLSLPLFVCSLVSTWYGGIFGVTRISFESGLYNFVTQGFFWYFSYILFALFLVDKIKKYQAVTLPDLVNHMFGPKAAKMAAVFSLFNVIPIAYTISLGILIDFIIGWGFLPSMCLGVFFVLIYSLTGGFRSVIYSDLVQFFVMFLSVILVLIYSFYTYGGFSFLSSNLPPSHFSLTGQHGWATTLVWGFIALSTLVDPNFYQRCFAAKDSTIAKKGILISTLIWFAFDISTTLGGMYAKAVLPDADPQYAYVTYSLQLLPNVIQGFFLAGITATIVSTLDSYLFLAGTTLAHDLLPTRYRQKIWAYRLSTCFIALVSIGLALAFEGNIQKVWKILGSYSASCLLLPVLYGHLSRAKISERDFIAACLLGVVTTTLWLIIERPGFWGQVDELYIGALASGLGLKLSKLLRQNT